MAIPFRQLAFEAVPEAPRVPHRFYSLAERLVAVSTPALGETRVSVRVTGQGPPLLLVHGLMTTAYTWRYVFESLAQRFTVYAVDLPGAGRTSTPAGPCTPGALADWLHALVEVLEIKGAAVIGNSMGGYLTMVWALRYPADLARLVVLHSPAAPIPRLYALWAAVRLPWAPWLLRRVVGGPDRVERFAHRNVHYYDESLKSREEAREYGGPLATEPGLRGFLSHLRDTMDVMALARFRDALLARRRTGQPFPVPSSWSMPAAIRWCRRTSATSCMPGFPTPAWSGWTRPRISPTWTRANASWRRSGRS